MYKNKFAAIGSLAFLSVVSFKAFALKTLLATAILSIIGSVIATIFYEYYVKFGPYYHRYEFTYETESPSGCNYSSLRNLLYYMYYDVRDSGTELGNQFKYDDGEIVIHCISKTGQNGGITAYWGNETLRFSY